MKNAKFPPMSELLRPVGECMTPEFAKNIVKLRADAKAQKRVSQLANKANEGELSESERNEYHSYVLTGNVIAYLQAQARILLAQTES